MKKSTLAPRERIVATAVRLFNEGGVHTTGIDRIIAESGVAKMTFYHHFPSKNKLIAEYFRQKDELWFTRLEQFTSNPKLSDLEQVLALFDGLFEWYKEKDFAGCPFIRGLADFGQDQSDPELVKCVDQHFERTMKLVEELLKKVRPKDFKKFVPQLMSLIAGATVVAQATGDSEIALVNKKMARTILSDKN